MNAHERGWNSQEETAGPPSMDCGGKSDASTLRSAVHPPQYCYGGRDTAFARAMGINIPQFTAHPKAPSPPGSAGAVQHFCPATVRVLA